MFVLPGHVSLLGREQVLTSEQDRWEQVCFSCIVFHVCLVWLYENEGIIHTNTVMVKINGTPGKYDENWL